MAILDFSGGEQVHPSLPGWYFYKMIRAGKAGEFLPCERLFFCQLKFLTIKEKFMKRFGKMVPCRSAMRAMAKSPVS